MHSTVIHVGLILLTTGLYIDSIASERVTVGGGIPRFSSIGNEGVSKVVRPGQRNRGTVLSRGSSRGPGTLAGAGIQNTSQGRGYGRSGSRARRARQSGRGLLDSEEVECETFTMVVNGSSIDASCVDFDEMYPECPVSVAAMIPELDPLIDPCTLEGTNTSNLDHVCSQCVRRIQTRLASLYYLADINTRDVSKGPSDKDNVTMTEELEDVSAICGTKALHYLQLKGLNETEEFYEAMNDCVDFVDDDVCPDEVGVQINKDMESLLVSCDQHFQRHEIPKSREGEHVALEEFAAESEGNLTRVDDEIEQTEYADFCDYCYWPIMQTITVNSLSQEAWCELQRFNDTEAPTLTATDAAKGIERIMYSDRQYMACLMDTMTDLENWADTDDTGIRVDDLDLSMEMSPMDNMNRVIATVCTLQEFLPDGTMFDQQASINALPRAECQA